MSPKRKIWASSVTTREDTKTAKIVFIILGIAVLIVIFLVKNYIGKTGDRFEGAKKFAEYHKFYFTERPLKFKAIGMVLMIRGNDLGTEFWTVKFPGMIAASEQETNALLAYDEAINKKPEKPAPRIISLADVPELYDILAEAAALSKITRYNIAAGDVFDFWDIALAKYEKTVTPANKNIETLLTDIGREPTMDAAVKAEKLAKIEQMKKIIADTRVLPDMKSLKEFIPFASPDNIVLDGVAKTITITSVNTGIKLKDFKESIFLEHLKKKMPPEMNYIIYLGNRHGIWKLPKEYVRFTVSIDDPADLIQAERGAIRLAGETGGFAITYAGEKSFIEEGKPYRLPVDWRTGAPVTARKSALVVDSSVIRARMLSYALFVSNEAETAAFEKQFPEQHFLVLNADQTIYIPASAKEIFVSLDEIKKAREERRKKLEEAPGPDADVGRL